MKINYQRYPRQFWLMFIGMLISTVVGSSLYTIAVTSVAFGAAFWSFWLSIVIMTIGEHILEPTANSYAANLAPPAKRGRYMSIFGMSWRIAIGLGPIIGGLLNDNIGPMAIWFGGTLIGLTSTILFVYLKHLKDRTNLRLYTQS